jgi:uncharacterized Rossmann fold enzyme
MLNVAAVCVGTAYSPLYVETLYSSIRRNLAAGLRGRFIVFTDHPASFKDMGGVQTQLVPEGLEGWWAKFGLFTPYAFRKGERVLYFDLDTVITGPLDAIAAYDGPFAILRDAYRPNGLQSSVMAWQAGNWTQQFWDEWNRFGRPKFDGGDQAMIEYSLEGTAQKFDIWQDLMPGVFRSYKVECQRKVPKGTSVVFFHGFPRPHQAGGWVKDAWKISDEQLFFAINVKEDELTRNIRHSLTKTRWLEMRDGSQFPAIIVGGGPSLEHDLWRIRGYQLSGGVVFATNNTYRYLKDAGITADAHVMHDAREENLAFVPDDETICYYASQCAPKVLDAAGNRLVCWHPHSDTVLETVGNDPKGRTMVSGGSTVGLNAMSIAYILGHRQFLLFGFDSSYADGEHHAYSQPLNDGELVLDVEACGQTFKCAPWMVQQSEQFMALTKQLIDLGCSLSVFGNGLIPTLARSAEVVGAADLRAKSIHERIREIPNPVGAEIGVFKGELSRKLLLRRDLTLYMVDSWTTEHTPEYTASGDFHAALSAGTQENCYQITRHVVHFAGERAKILRKDSREAAKDIPDGSLDFVFIDADHSYEGCRADIEAWLPKVKAGGFIAGHDYDNAKYPQWGVKRAVDEMFGKVDLGENFTWFQRIQHG